MAKTGTEEDCEDQADSLAGSLFMTQSRVDNECAGNGRSSNGSSDTPQQPRKRPRRLETWNKTARGEEYVSPSTGETVAARTTGPLCSCNASIVSEGMILL